MPPKRLYLGLPAALALVGALFLQVPNDPPIVLETAEQNTAEPVASTPVGTSSHGEVVDSLPAELPSAEPLPVADERVLGWPAGIVDSLRLQYPGYETAVEFITRAIEFETFASLTTDHADRLVRYAQAVSGASGERLLYLCWGHDTEPQVVSAFEGVRSLAIQEAIEAGDPLPIFQANPWDRWSQTATDGNTGSLGTAVTITWSFVPDGTAVPDGGKNAQGNDTMATSDLIAKLNAAYGSPTTPGDLTTAPWFVIFDDAFNSWSEVTGNTYVYEPNDDGANFPDFRGGTLGVRGDVRIGGTRIDGNSRTLAFNYFPDAGDMVIDSDDTSNLRARQEALFENTIAHEHGHGLGFGHVCPINQTKLMEPFITLQFSGPQYDDVLTAQRFYGDPREPKAGSKNNETPATAYDLGALDGIYNESAIVSISGSSDVDVYRFEVANPRELNVTLAPTLEPDYLEGPRNLRGCSAGVLFDPTSRQNLSMRVLASDGVTELGSSDSNGIGQGEALNGLQLLQTNQSYYLEVSGGGENSGDGNNAQIYSLQLEFLDPSDIQFGKFTLISEGCAPANGSPDPGEWVTGSVLVENIGAQTETGVQVSLLGGAGLTVQGSAVQTIASLAAGASTTLTFTFSLDGDCRADASVTFRANWGLDEIDLVQNFTLGSSIGVVFLEDVDSTGIGSLPAGFSQLSSTGLGSWSTTNSDSSSPSNSLFASAVDENSSFLTSPVFLITKDSELRFEHRYKLETGTFVGFDGGVLEISIDNGPWVEWTAVGGTFTANGYVRSISTQYGSAISGQSAWTGDSGGFIKTIASFPPSSIGQEVRVRWHQANDTLIVRDGWWIDDIELIGAICCESQTPVLSVAALNPTLEEFDPATTADFVVTSDISVPANLNLAYTLSGAAVSGSDFLALAGSATINSGMSMVSIPVTVIADSEIEGDELLTLTLSPSIDYGIGTASAGITIKDLPFDAFRFDSFGGATINVGDDEDFDLDGLVNLIEYAFRLDATAPSVLPFILIVDSASGPELQLTYYEDTALADVNYIVETSTTLAPGSWTTGGVTISNGPLNDGLQERTASIQISNTPGFIRIRVERILP